jgi:hypothetical protein
MSVTFTKLFSSITESTIWSEPDQTRIVWITMLAMADHAGRVWASIPGLANRARVSLEACEKALETLKSPDPYSRTKDNEGRRIEDIDGGWRLLTHAKYRAIRDTESIRESKRLYMQRKRAESGKGGTKANAVERGGRNAEAEAEAEAETDKNPPNPPKGGRSRFALPDWIPEDVWEDYKEHRKKLRKPMTGRAQEMAVRDLERIGGDPVAIIHQSIAKGWAGLFPVKQELPNGRRKTQAELAWDEYEASLRDESGAGGDTSGVAPFSGGPKRLIGRVE